MTVSSPVCTIRVKTKAKASARGPANDLPQGGHEYEARVKEVVTEIDGQQLFQGRVQLRCYAWHREDVKLSLLKSGRCPLRLSSSAVILIILAMLTATPFLCSQPSDNGNNQELERLEKVWNEAHEHGDAEALNALWADDMEIAVPKMPVMSKADALGFARSGRMKFLRYQTSDIHIRVYGDAAVVTGRLQRTRSMNGQEMADDWRFTKTYVRQAGQWRVVAFHASEAAQP